MWDKSGPRLWRRLAIAPVGALVLTPLFGGIAWAQMNDPPWYCLGGTPGQNCPQQQPAQPTGPNGGDGNGSFEQQATDQIWSNTECMLALNTARSLSRDDPNLLKDIVDGIKNCGQAFAGSFRLLTPQQLPDR